MNEPIRATCRHGLVYDPTRHAGCVVCRREQVSRTAKRSSSAAEPAAGWLRSMGSLALGMVGVGCVVAWFLLSSEPAEPMAEVTRGLRQTSDVAPPPASAGEPQAEARPAPGPAAPPRPEATAPALPRPTSSQAPVPEQVAPSAAEQAAQARQLAVREAMEQRATEAAVTRARARVSITVYTTSWCPHCDRAKDYMRTAGIRYVERNVEGSPTNRARRDRLNPRGSVPTFDIDGEVMVGFSPGGLERRIEQAARRRL